MVSARVFVCTDWDWVQALRATSITTRHRSNLTLILLILFLPILCSCEESVNALLLERSQVLQVGDAVAGFEEVEILAGLELSAFPAAFDALLLAALPHLAEWRTTTASAGFLAAKLHQSAQNLVALIIMLKRFEKGDSFQDLSRLVELGSPQFFSKVSGQVSNFAVVANAISTV
jgi:hypothetical protein